MIININESAKCTGNGRKSGKKVNRKYMKDGNRALHVNCIATRCTFINSAQNHNIFFLNKFSVLNVDDFHLLIMSSELLFSCTFVKRFPLPQSVRARLCPSVSIRKMCTHSVQVNLYNNMWQ